MSGTVVDSDDDEVDTTTANYMYPVPFRFSNLDGYLFKGHGRRKAGSATSEAQKARPWVSAAELLKQAQQRKSEWKVQWARNNKKAWKTAPFTKARQTGKGTKSIKDEPLTCYICGGSLFSELKQNTTWADTKTRPNYVPCDARELSPTMNIDDILDKTSQDIRYGLNIEPEHILFVKQLHHYLGGQAITGLYDFLNKKHKTHHSLQALI